MKFNDWAGLVVMSLGIAGVIASTIAAVVFVPYVGYPMAALVSLGVCKFGAHLV